MRRDCNIILSHKIKLSYIMNKFTYILFVFLCLISCAQPNNKKQVLKDRGCDITKKNVTGKTTFYDFFKNLLDFGNDKIYNQYTAFAESLIQKSEKLKNNFKSC